MHRIEAAVVVSLIWDDDANEWKVDPAEAIGDLEWSPGDTPAAVGDAVWPYPHAVVDRAMNHPVTATDLSFMLQAL